MKGRKVLLIREATDPDKIDGPDDLPKDIKDALPDGAEKMFYAALVAAKEAEPDKQEGVWYALAWDAVNNEYEKTDDGDWEKKESMSYHIDSILNESKSKVSASKAIDLIKKGGELGAEKGREEHYWVLRKGGTMDDRMMIDKKTFDKIQKKLGSKLKVTQTSINPPLYYWVMK